MAVSMEDVRRVLDPEEPNYAKVAQLGPEALPLLGQLVRGADAMLASKAAYAASLVGEEGHGVLEAAARSENAAVRVAAAAGARNLASERSQGLLRDLRADPDPGVRKIARAGDDNDAAGQEAGSGSGGGASLLAGPSTLAPGEDLTSMGGLMPGEQPRTQMPGRSSGLMPGESREDMPGGTG